MASGLRISETSQGTYRNFAYKGMFILQESQQTVYCAHVAYCPECPCCSPSYLMILVA